MKPGQLIVRKILFIVAGIVLFHLSAGQMAVAGESAVPSGMSPVIPVRDMVLSYFVPVEGEITVSAAGAVTVRLKAAADLKKGVRLSVFRKGEPFYHPITRELIGYAETPVGTIEVRDAVEHSTIVQCISVSGTFQPGDLVRISSSKIRLAFFQDLHADWPLSEAFYTALKDSGRFEILESYTPDYETATLSRAAKDLGANAFLMLTTPVKQDAQFLNIRLYWASDAVMFLSAESMMSSEALARMTPDAGFVDTSSVDREPRGVYTLERAELLAIGDVDGNGAIELVTSDGTNIRVYSMKDELQEIWVVKGDAEEQHLSVDVLDVNHDGKAEIFVTALSGGRVPGMQTGDSLVPSGKNMERVISYVVEYDPASGYRRIAGPLPYFLRVSGGRLLMQKFTSEIIFTGQVYEGQWSDGQYRPVKPLKLPAGVNIYGFAMVDWDNAGKAHVLTYDDRGHLNLYDEQGNFLWKSSVTYGESAQSFSKKSDSPVGGESRWHVRGRLVTLQSKRGQEVLALERIPYINVMPGAGVKGAELYSLWWDGSDMEETAVLREIPGSVTDFRVENGEVYLVAGGNLVSLMKNAASGEFAKGSRLYYYRLSEK